MDECYCLKQTVIVQKTVSLSSEQFSISQKTPIFFPTFLVRNGVLSSTGLYSHYSQVQRNQPLFLRKMVKFSSLGLMVGNQIKVAI